HQYGRLIICLEQAGRISAILGGPEKCRGGRTSILRSGVRIPEKDTLVFAGNRYIQQLQPGVSAQFILLNDVGGWTNILIICRSDRLHSTIIVFPERVEFACSVQIARLHECAFTGAEETTAFVGDYLQLLSDISALCGDFTLTKERAEFYSVGETNPP